LDILMKQQENDLELDFDVFHQVQNGSLPLTDNAYSQLVEHWILRLLLDMGAHKSMLFPTHIRDDEVFVAIGLGMICQQEQSGEYDHRTAIKLVATRYSEIAKRPPKPPRKRPLETNLQWLGKRLGLSETDVTILRFIVLSEDCEHLRTVLEHLGPLSLQTIQRLLALLLNLPEVTVAAALRPDSALATCGLVRIDYDFKGSYRGKIDLLRRLSDQLFNSHSDPMHMLRERVVPGKTAKLSPDDYHHVRDDFSLLKRYLEASKGKEGINFLIYGPPGTGKTEFVRMLAAALGLTLFEVATQDRDSSPLSGRQRLLAFRLAEQMLRSEAEALVLFDEIEDVFRDPEDAEKHGNGNAAGRKAWINQLLETNPVPAFWVSNAIHAIDKAVIRRFDYVLHLENPPREIRAKILRHYFDRIPVSDGWIKQLSECERLAPAVVERTAKVAASLEGMQSHEVERAASRIISGSLKAMELPPINRGRCQTTTEYRLDCLNTDPSVESMAEQLAKTEQGRFCLYGPPGTGKTAFGRYLAQALGKRLLVKRASDLLSPYVGVAEKNMASMFAEAADERAVLLLDEADTFLQDRSTAVRSWEISQVNEMLTQIEQYGGIFIASTNLMGSLDSATLRRFDLKIRFDWMKPEQIERLFDDALRQFGIAPDADSTGRARILTMLTPGDFANVFRQARLSRIDSAQILLRRLEAEVQAKPQGKQLRRIGF